MVAEEALGALSGWAVAAWIADRVDRERPTVNVEQRNRTELEAVKRAGAHLREPEPIGAVRGWRRRGGQLWWRWRRRRWGGWLRRRHGRRRRRRKRSDAWRIWRRHRWWREVEMGRGVERAARIRRARSAHGIHHTGGAIWRHAFQRPAHRIAPPHVWCGQQAVAADDIRGAERDDKERLRRRADCGAAPVEVVVKPFASICGEDLRD